MKVARLKKYELQKNPQNSSQAPVTAQCCSALTVEEPEAATEPEPQLLQPSPKPPRQISSMDKVTSKDGINPKTRIDEPNNERRANIIYIYLIGGCCKSVSYFAGSLISWE